MGRARNYSMRQQALQLCYACILMVALTVLFAFSAQAANPNYGAEANPTGDPIGGGVGYSNIVSNTQAQFFVTSKAQLLAAATAATSGQIIYVADDAKIDLTGENPVSLSAGVTLASGRGRAGSRGGLIYVRDHIDGFTPMLLLNGADIRVTGLRLRGADTEIGDHTYGGQFTIGRGIRVNYPGCEVDNCELYGWGHVAIYLPKTATNSFLHHNYFHHNRRIGNGYGISLGVAYDSYPIYTLIEANLFEHNRHDIAGNGSVGNSYEARYNLSLYTSIDHNFDMHDGGVREDGTAIAGDWIKVYRNTFMNAYVPAVCIRGIPRYEAQIHNNWFYHSDSTTAVRQINSTGNMTVTDNYTGKVPPIGTVLPVPEISAPVLCGTAPLTLDFDGSGSSDADGSLIAWEWKFGDETDPVEVADGARVRHVFTDPGRYLVSLTVQDNTGIRISTMVPVNVTPSAGTFLSLWVKDSFREDKPGYFKKEVLVDDEVVWQEDAAGDQGWQHVCVDVSDRVAGKASVKIAMRLTCLRDITFPAVIDDLFTYTDYTDIYSYWDDVVLSGFALKNADFESSGNWTYSEGNGTQPKGFLFNGEYRSGFGSYMIYYPYMGNLSAGAWAQAAQTATDLAPAVSASSPRGAAVPADANISVTFSKPTDAQSAEDAFSVSPSIGGSFSWSGNTLTFAPDARLRYGSAYTVTVSTAVRDSAAKRMVEPWTWQFTVEISSPVITFVSPHDGFRVFGITSVEVNVTDAIGLDTVEFHVDGILRGTRTSAPFLWTWDPGDEENTAHELKIVARSISGGISEKSITVRTQKAEQELVYPNPYIKGKSTGGEKVVFSNLPAASTIRIYTIAGDLIATIPHPQPAAGGSEQWDVSVVASGIYLYAISDSETVRKGKIGIVK